MDHPYSGMNQMFTPPPPGLGFSNDVQNWRETGFPMGDGSYWNRPPPPMTESGLSRFISFLLFFGTC
jgi:hypothetical protein